MRDSSTEQALPGARTGTAHGSPEDLRANARNSPVMRPMRSASWAMRSEVDLHGGGSPAQKPQAVARQGTQRRQGLVQFMGHAGGELADHRQLARLHQLVLRGPCRVASARMRSCTSAAGVRWFVASRTCAAAPLRSSSSCAACSASRAASRSRTDRAGARRRRWLSMKPSSAKKGRARAGNQGVTLGRLVGPRHGEHGERPRCARQGTRWVRNRPVTGYTDAISVPLARHTHHARALVRSLSTLMPRGERARRLYRRVWSNACACSRPAGTGP